jgi:integrase
MGRPPLAIGTAGAVRIYQRGDSFIACTLFRDIDGKTRSITRTGKTRGAARQALAQAVKDRQIGNGDIGPETKVAVVAELWWEEFQRGQPSPNTKRLYRDRLDRQILPSLGDVRLRELSVGVCDRHIQSVAATHGIATAKATKSVLSGVCKYAARHDAIDRNPVRDIGPIHQSKPRRPTQALSADEAIELRDAYRSDPLARKRDLPDLLDFMLATGLRISEACAVEWDDIDLEQGIVSVGDAVVIRERGVGLYIRYEKSSKLRERALELPDWAALMLRRRKAISTSQFVFPSPKGRLRDPSNVSADIKEAFTKAGFPWATTHTFRRTVASLMDESGLSARAAADQLGHARVSMTQDHYFRRARVVRSARPILESIRHIIREEDDDVPAIPHR